MFLPDLPALLQKISGIHVAVAGDLMLDRYIWGRVERISPEAPVPVVNVERRSHSLGGSANVVHNLQALGARVLPLGVTGSDGAAELVIGMLRAAGVSVRGIVKDDERPTTVKTRIIANDQHVVRVDEEHTDPVRKHVRENLLDRFREACPDLDALIFEDYDKGVLDAEFIAQLREEAVRANLFTAVDPKLAHFHAYGPVSLFKPNEKEILRATGSSLIHEEDLAVLGQGFQQESGCKELVVTRGSRGMALFNEKQELIQLPALSRTIVDVSGAGDTVIAALVLARCAGVDLEQAGRFASLCAALVCGELGAVPVDKDALLALNASL